VTVQVSKFIQTGLYLQFLYDKEIDKGVRIKQTLGMGLSCKLRSSRLVPPFSACASRTGVHFTERRPNGAKMEFAAPAAANQSCYFIAGCLTLQLLIPNGRYAGHQPIAAVASGTMR